VADSLPAAPRLYLVSDRSAVAEAGHGLALTDCIERALRGGADAVQLRERDLPADQLLDLALRIAALCRRHRAMFLVNDRVDVALASGADGVHLPASSFAVADARRLLGNQRIVAASTHTPEEARTAADAGADFIVFGPVRPTPSKAGYGPPRGVDELRRVAAAVAVPVLAIGGIDTSCAAQVVAAGASGIAVIRAILAADRPESAAAELRAAIGQRRGLG